MSVGRPNGNEFISPEIYISNQVKIEQARKLLEDMEKKNEMGLQNFTERERQQQAAEMQLMKQKEELHRKIQEGLEAQRLIEELERRQSAPLSEMSEVGGARIEEVQDSIQSMPPALPDMRVAGAQSSNVVPQYQNQTTQQPQQLVNHPSQINAYASSITAPLAAPTEFPQNPSLLSYPSVQYGQFIVLN
ncbi:hypothetical protein HYPSUDRAFT_234805 [Hypholoma sublateritium FD-334 SS-4]|uniref:Uncharacterized protein n=1 Tax=Hypholoma sublateritium (strain FD-334 SS-4) TaxID=945553 RepID=A0A0D2PNJ8_HYPSF|nr:hypothetical protein HYPSUDRAFT_234805 [Hypholoma sublateritium FD-334 SS-4]